MPNTTDNRWKELLRNVALAALASGLSVLYATDKPSVAVFTAAGYAALRAGIGALLIFTKDR